MSLLLAGILLWALVHFIPVFAPSFRKNLINKIGLNAFKGIFTIAMVGAIALIYQGWQAYPEAYHYPQAAGMREIALILVFMGIVSFIASARPTNIKRFMRHPQLNGVMLWALAHLLANGEARNVLLFSGLLIWAFLMKIGANKRDGVWEKPDPVDSVEDIKVVTAAVVFYAFLAYAHQYFTNIPIY